MKTLPDLTFGGLYSVAVTDNKNCLADTSLIVNDGTTLIAQVTAKTPVLCFGDNNGSAEVTTINGIPPYNYQWSDGLSTALNVRTNLPSGTYQVMVSDAASPAPHTTQVEVVIDGPVAALSALLDPTYPRCYQDSGTVALTVAGGTLPYRYIWNTGYVGEDLTEIPAGSYSVTVTDTNNCSAQNNIEITEPPAVTLDVTIDSQNLCNGDNTASATANVTGGSGNYSYLWTDPGAQVTKTAVQLFAGNYTVTVTDQNGCKLSAPVPITEPDSLLITATIISALLCWRQRCSHCSQCNRRNTAIRLCMVKQCLPAHQQRYSCRKLFSYCNRYKQLYPDQDTFVVTDPLPVVINQVDSTDATLFWISRRCRSY